MTTYTESKDWIELKIGTDFTVYLEYQIIVLKDGVNYAYNRQVDMLKPGDTITSYPQKIQNILNAAWAGLT